MPSVPYANPQSPVTFWHQLPIVADHTTFLCVLINCPDKQFQLLQDIIVNFEFPILSTRLQLTILRCIISQVLISKIQPHLSLQSISSAHALELDHLITSKIHHYLGFPFHFNTSLLEDISFTGKSSGRRFGRLSSRLMAMFLLTT